MAKHSWKENFELLQKFGRNFSTAGQGKLIVGLLSAEFY